MVRRRSSKSKDTKPGPRPVHKKDGKIKRWNKPSDIPIDEEDRFHASRDHILLDGDDGAQEDDDDGEEEVFALKGMPQSDSEQSEEGEDGEDEDVDMEDVEEEEPPQKKAAKAKGKRASRQDPAPDGASDKSDDEEEEEGWGHKKSAYYSTNAEELDSEDDEANELEEKEARRLQSKSRDFMNEDDFGMGDVAEPDLLDDPVEDILADAPPKVETQPLPKDKASILRHLEKTSPETLALANDWDDVAHKLLRSQEKLKQLESDEPDSLSLGMVHLHYQTLLTYATTLAFYLHLRAGEKYAQRPELLRAHPVFARLLQLKQALSTLEDLDFDLSSSDAGSDDEDDEDLYIDDDEFSDLMDEDGAVAGAGERARAFGSGRGALMRDFEQLTRILREAEEDAAPAPPNGPERAHPKKKDGKAKSRSDLARRGGGGSEPPAGGPPKKKRKTDAARAAPVFDLVEPEFVSSARKSGSGGAPSADGAADAYGEAAALAAADAEDKSARRKTLRFHTAKIESASARRRGARAALGGDDDVPYRERRQAREARAAREAAARGLGTGGADLDGEEPQSRKRDEDRDGDGDGSAEEEAADGYYDLVKRKKKERKEEKQAAYDAAKAASMPSLDDDAEAGGPRALTRAILKNRGLTPHRSKSVRNPRVKKRQKFDKAKKVLASQKAVFKGGDASRYEGERTGISTVVKSVRF